MRNIAVKLILVLFFASGSFAAMENLIYNGSFDSDILNSVEASGLSVTTDELNQWHTFSQGNEDFYRITEEEYVTANKKQQWGRLLTQIIAAPEAGEYDFEFDYRLTDDSDMYSVVRVFAIDDDDENFSIGMTTWTGSFSNVISATRVYDQGDRSSSLPTAAEWTNVSSKINVSSGVDYLVIYAAFSHNGTDYSLNNNFADLDNFSLKATTIVPEPATLAILGLGAFFLIKTKKN